MGIETSAAHGGAESSFTSAIIAIEELARVDPSVSVLCDVHNTLVNTVIRKYGTEGQQEKWLPQLAESKVRRLPLVSPLPLPDVSIARQLLFVRGGFWFRRICPSNARNEGRGPLDNQWFENVDHELARSWSVSHLCQCACPFSYLGDSFSPKKPLWQIDPSKGYKGITCFVATKDMGIQIAKKEQKLGIRASSTCTLNFDDLKVPAENVIGGEGLGYKIAIEILNEGPAFPPGSASPR
jgi:short/branched chain acyl-CoA dehydrogenase